MAIDFAKMKQKFQALQGKGSDKQNVFWKPQDGDQSIRIIPTADGDPFKEFHFHYNVGKNPGFICPKKQHGKDCPVCNFAWHIYNEAKTNNDGETLKLAKSLFPKKRFFSPVVVRGEEDQGVRLWGYGKMAYTELIQLVLNPDYGDITDVDGGTDLVINYGKPAGASFPVTKIHPRRRPSAIAESKEGIQSILDGIPEFEENFNVKTIPEIEEMLNGFLSGESTDNETTSETTKYNNNEASDVDAAFKELLS
tara:strand:- start:907 stop:1662 length:756 start_codon:yes stop_codon:yes gene_type:complete